MFFKSNLLLFSVLVAVFVVYWGRDNCIRCPARVMCLRVCVRYRWRIQGRGLGSVPPSLPFLDQTEAQGAEKCFSEVASSFLPQGVDDRHHQPPPPPIWRSGSVTVSVSSFSFLVHCPLTLYICKFPIILFVCSFKFCVHVYYSRPRSAKFSGATKVYYGRVASGECKCKLSYSNFNFYCV